MLEHKIIDDRKFSEKVEFVIQKSERYTIEFWKTKYQMDSRQARRMIRHMLKDLNYSINTKAVQAASIAEAEGDDIGDAEYTQTGYANRSYTGGIQYTGVVMALCNCNMNSKDINSWDTQNQIGPVVAGRPVVFDTQTGYALTGINPLWMPDEYQVFGTALQSGVSNHDLGFDLQRLPVLLHKQHIEYSQFFLAELQEELLPPKPAKARIIENYGGYHGPFSTSGNTSYGYVEPLREEHQDDAAFGWQVRVDDHDEGYDFLAFSFAAGLKSRTHELSGNHYYTNPRYPKEAQVVVAYDYVSSRWVIISHKFIRQTIRGVLHGELLSGSYSEMILQRLNPDTKLWETWVDESGKYEMAIVYDFHLPPQTKLPGGTRITADYDWNSGEYVVLAVNPINYLGDEVYNEF